MKILRAYRVRLEPTVEQRKVLAALEARSSVWQFKL